MMESQMETMKGLYNAVTGNPTVQNVANTTAAAVGTAVNTVNDGIRGDIKQRDLSTYTVEDCQKGNYITTDFGTRMSDTDTSLKVMNTSRGLDSSSS